MLGRRALELAVGVYLLWATTASPPATSPDAAAASSSSSTSPAQSLPFRPNILFIISDDHSTEAVGFRPSSRLGALAETNHLNRLAAQGAVIEDSFVVLSLCSPSRATILTGKYPHQHGVTGLNGRMRSSAVTYVSKLRDAGYRTGIVGKVRDAGWYTRSDGTTLLAPTPTPTTRRLPPTHPHPPTPSTAINRTITPTIHPILPTLAVTFVVAVAPREHAERALCGLSDV